MINDNSTSTGLTGSTNTSAGALIAPPTPNSIGMGGKWLVDQVGDSSGLASNQTIDPNLARILGNVLYQNTDDADNWYYRGGTDYSTADLGLNGRKTLDLGNGKYSILGSQGQDLGFGYKGVRDAARDFMGPDEIPSEYSNQVDEYGNPVSYSNRDQWDNSAPYDTRGDLAYWEALGQGLNGSMSNYLLNAYRFLPGNNANESITGANTLFGSTPILFGDKLLGYNMDLSPGKPGDSGYQNPYYSQLKLDTKNKKYNMQLYRELNDPSEWGKHGLSLDADNFAVSPEEAANLPGWTNKDTAQYWKKKDDGGFSKILSGLGALLQFTPLAPMGIAMMSMVGLANRNLLQTLGPLAGAYFGGMGGMEGVGGAAGGAAFDSAALADAASAGFGSVAEANLAASQLGGVGGYANAALQDAQLAGYSTVGQADAAANELTRLQNPTYATAKSAYSGLKNVKGALDLYKMYQNMKAGVPIPEESMQQDSASPLSHMSNRSRSFGLSGNPYRAPGQMARF